MINHPAPNLFKREDFGYNLLASRLSTGNGEVAEWLKASVSKTDISSDRYRGFESRPLRQT